MEFQPIDSKWTNDHIMIVTFIDITFEHKIETAHITPPLPGRF